MYEYSRALVSYIDILGFRQLLKTKDCAHVHGLIETLGATFMHSMHVRVNRLTGRTKCGNYSDHLVRTTTIEGSGAEMTKFELLDLAIVQQHMARQGTLLRGAVVVGSVYHAEAQPTPEPRQPPMDQEPPRPGISYCYGQALVDVYKLESRTAEFPRLVVSNEIKEVSCSPQYELGEWYIDAAKLGDQKLAPLLREDRDGVVFIDYLSIVPKEVFCRRPRLGFTGCALTEYSDLLQEHRKLTQKLLKKALGPPEGPERRSILCKALWLKDYHNEIISRIPRGVLTELKLRKDKLLVV